MENIDVKIRSDVAMAEQAKKFDLCVSELTPGAQKWFKQAVKDLASQLKAGGGEMSAKSVLYAICLLDKPFSR